MPITHLHGVQVGEGVPGPVTRDLVKTYMERMADPAYGLAIKADREQTFRYMGAE